MFMREKNMIIIINNNKKKKTIRNDIVFSYHPFLPYSFDGVLYEQRHEHQIPKP